MAPSFCDAADWSVVWRDEFDAPLNPHWWNVPHGVAPLPQQLEADCHGSTCILLGSCREAACTRDSVSVRGGRLVLTSQRRRVLGRNLTTGAVNKEKDAAKSHTAQSRAAKRAYQVPVVPVPQVGYWSSYQ